ncbi:hypothetical protein ACFSM5_22175 [Lacibacterium aquatile]|uniref:Uncharacterized protein n=1 Tax=Lacibacterium aquatile TaxID=1168082 RepID=A0ABW5DXW2_9PROT
MIQDLTQPLPAEALTMRKAAQFAPGHLVFLKEHGVMLRFDIGGGKKHKPMLLALQLSEGHSIGDALEAEKTSGYFFGTQQPATLAVRVQEDPNDEISHEGIKGKIVHFAEGGWRIIGLGLARPFRQQYFIDPIDWTAKPKPDTAEMLVLDRWRLSLPLPGGREAAIDV